MVPDYGTLKYTEKYVPWCIHGTSKNITVLLWDIYTGITLGYNVYGMYVVLFKIYRFYETPFCKISVNNNQLYL